MMCDAEAVLKRADIEAGLRGLGLSAGAGVIVHSSLKSFGRVDGGPDAVIDALMSALTPEGTLMMPAFNFGRWFDTPGNEAFDPAATPSAVGAITDRFWRREGVCRSWNPTHSFAAWGKNAQRYTRMHHRVVTMGPDSPLGLLGREGGYGLLLGVTYKSNTFHHVVETTLDAPCLGPRSDAFPMRLSDGRIVESRTWSWRGQSCPINDPARYGEFMGTRGLERTAMIGSCRATLFKLADCFDVIAELLGNGLGEFPPCSRCPIRPRQDASHKPSDWDSGRGCLLPDSPALQY